MLSILSGICLSPIGRTLEKNTSLPWLFNWRGPLPAPNNIVIVGLNSGAAERMGLSRHSITWSRSVYAQLIDRLTAADANLTVLDIALKTARDEEQDSQLEAALAKNQKVLLYTYFKRHQIPLAEGSADIEQAIPPLPRFNAQALGSGHFTLIKSAVISEAVLFKSDAENTYQSQPLLAFLAITPFNIQRDFWQLLRGGELDPTLSLQDRAQLFRQAVTAPPQNIKSYDLKKYGQSISNKHLFDIFSLDKNLLINFYGPTQTFHHIDIDQALALTDSEFKRLFSQKIVYVGYLETRQTEQQDAYQTVFTGRQGMDVSGVEISATVFSNLLNNTFIRDYSPPLMWAITLLAFGCGFMLARLPLLFNLAAQSCFLMAYLVAAYYVFSRFNFALPLVLPIAGLLLGMAAQLQHIFILNSQRLHTIRFALSQYLPSDAAKAVSENIHSLEQQHSLVFGVVLMTDIKGYTALSESLPPAQLHQLMNRYYEQLIAIVKSHNGTIGNIVGDSLMAIWTAPALTTAMCQQAFKAVQDIQQKVSGDSEFAVHLPTCAALHGGQFSLGNLGGTGHYEYSPVGDIINTVSRIEAFNRNLNTTFLCSSVIYDYLAAVPNHHGLCPLGQFALRNKKDAVALFTSLETSNNSCVASELFARALAYFEAKDFDRALTLFNELQAHELAGPSEYYINSCLANIALSENPA
ncbi:MAG: adenylate/guanylate cyclase domain-containing protein [Marinagarivorans sp.]|nr:adenylate/guanylate cyclase domain-containing protein [Marinagarivorans sp.]